MRGHGCPVYDGEFLIVPAGARVDKNGVITADPIKKTIFGGDYPVFAMKDVSQDVKDYFYDMTALRWTPETGRFDEEKIAWPTRG